MEIICTALGLYLVVLFIRIVLSWFPTSPGSVMGSVEAFLRGLTDPVLVPLRRAIPPVRMGGMGLDLSPMIVIFGIYALQQLLC